jgi:hypothetical protein
LRPLGAGSWDSNDAIATFRRWRQRQQRRHRDPSRCGRSRRLADGWARNGVDTRGGVTEDDGVSFEGLAPVTDVSVGAWIAPRLCGFGGRVCCVVPAGFAGCARVLHPPAGEHGDLVSWAQVCELTGRIAHPLMQWHAISAAPQTGAQTESSSWPGTAPEVGNLPSPLLAGVLEILAGFTADPGDCYHAVWDGWGWLHGSGTTIVSYHESVPPRFRAPPPAPPALPGEVLGGPRLSHPGRDYLLFHGPLQAAQNIGRHVAMDWRLPQSPSLLWPADRSWLLATEIDFDSTLVGGSAELVTELLHATSLEAWPVRVDDDLSIDGDRINQ